MSQYMVSLFNRVLVATLNKRRFDTVTEIIF